MTSSQNGPLTPRPSLDPHVSLALGMAARPGATAVLAGAGLSVGAGVPAAWEVQRELLGRAAAAAGDEPPDDVFEWWLARTGVQAAYDDVLFAAASTSLGRKDLLRPFFEPTEDERRQGIKVPSAGHRALAQLMRDGLVRIIVTLNFDLLIETALRELGIEPTVVSTVDDVRGMEPLHAQQYLVWHLHGDYTNPEMLNTPDELRKYDPIVNERLDELFDQYGLLVVGWSAVWDPALRSALARCSSRRYPTTWLDRGSLREGTSRLARARDAAVVQGGADEWLSKVVDACRAVRARSTDPLTPIGEVEAFKRELASSPRPIAAHDRVHREAERITALPVMQRTQAALQTMTYSERLPVLEAEMEAWTGLVAAAAYWGNEQTDPWWMRYIAQFGSWSPLSGPVDAIDSFTTPAVIATYAAGTAAVAANRWELLCRLLAGVALPLRFRVGRAPASAVLTPSFVYSHTPWPSRRLAKYIWPILSDVVGIGSGIVLEAWEQYEYVNWMLNDERARRNLPYVQAYPMPYVRVDDNYGAGRHEVTPVPRSFITENEVAYQAILDVLFDGDADVLEQAMDRADDSISRSVRDSELADLMRRGGSGAMPSGRRYAQISD